MHFRDRVGEQHHCHVHAAQQRVRRPAEHPHEPAGGASRTGLAIGHQILSVVEYDRDPLPLLGRVDQVAFQDRVDSRDSLIGVAGPRGGVANPLGEPLGHRPQPIRVGAGERPQPLADVVGQHDVPAAEHLTGQKVGNRPPGRRISSRAVDARRRDRHEVANIAVYQEDAARPGEIRVAEPLGPGRAPVGQRSRAARRGRGAKRRRRLGRCRLAR